MHTQKRVNTADCSPCFARLGLASGNLTGKQFPPLGEHFPEMRGVAPYAQTVRQRGPRRASAFLLGVWTFAVR